MNQYTNVHAVDEKVKCIDTSVNLAQLDGKPEVWITRVNVTLTLDSDRTQVFETTFFTNAKPEMAVNGKEVEE